MQRTENEKKKIKRNLYLLGGLTAAVVVPVGLGILEAKLEKEGVTIEGMEKHLLEYGSCYVYSALGAIAGAFGLARVRIGPSADNDPSPRWMAAVGIACGGAGFGVGYVAKLIGKGIGHALYQ
jgi:hypothetical protein